MRLALAMLGDMVKIGGSPKMRSADRYLLQLRLDENEVVDN